VGKRREDRSGITGAEVTNLLARSSVAAFKILCHQ
jgi:hypothetical protein